MGLTSLPTKSDGSLGRVKSALPGSDPSPDLDYYVTAAEHEAIKDAIVGLGAEVGLHDGSTAGSLVERVTALAALPIRRVTGSTTLLESDLVVIVDASGGPAVVTGATVVTGAPRFWVVKKSPGNNTNKLTLARAGSELIEGAAASLDLPNSDVSSAVGPSYTVVRDTDGNLFLLG